jgi:hypothetical protein
MKKSAAGDEKGEAIVKFQSLRTSLAGSALALSAALFLGSCGGGGAESNNTGGNLVLLPNLGVTFYAGVPATMTVGGGRHPYRITSSQPGIFPVPDSISNNSFTVIPGNPGVIDDSVQVGQLPIRSVTVQVTDAENNFQQAIIEVAQNFIMGYGLTYTSNCTVTVGTPPPACAGGETVIRIEPTFNGRLVPHRTLRLEILRGPLVFLYAPNGAVAGNTVTVTSDEMGRTFAVMRIDTGVPTQTGFIRLIDVETGMFADQVFPITGVATATQLEIIPDEFTFTGAFTNQCGTGSGSFLVYDGVPPYTAVSSFGEVTLNNTTSDTNPGMFTFNVSNPNVCLTDATIVVQDSRLVRGTVTITTEAGTNDPPPPPLRAVPTSITLSCTLLSGSFLVAGGDPAVTTINAATNDPTLTLSVAGRTVSVTYNPPGGGLTPTGPNVTGTVSATDGASVVSVPVRHPPDCT